MLSNIYRDEVNKIISNVNSHAKQYYLDLKITKPSPSEQKLGLLFLYLYANNITLEKIHAVCSAAGLVQLGLDTHEFVTNETLHSPKKNEIRQLQVLAGDYFSSQYYRLLAISGNSDAIQKIAFSVRNINQHKVNYYQAQNNMQLSYEQELAYQIDIAYGLFYGFIPEAETNWSNIIKGFITLEILQYDTTFPLKIRIAQECFANIKQGLRVLQNKEIQQQLQHLLQQYEFIFASNLVAEEI